MVSIIAAMTEKDRVIGKDQDLPWRLPEDLKRFKKLTINHPVIMGRKSYEAIGHALPKRDNIVLTRQEEYHLNDAKVFNTLEKAVNYAKEIDSEIFIIGGEEIFREALNQGIVDKMYLTIIKQDFDGDTFFPEIDESNWKISRDGEQESKNNILFEYVTYSKSSQL